MSAIPAGQSVAREALSAVDSMLGADERTVRQVEAAAGANRGLQRLRDAVDVIVSGKRLSYREAAILQAQYKLLDASLDVTLRIKGGRTAAQRLSEGLAERRIPCTKDAFTAAALGHGSRSLVQGAFEEWDQFIAGLNSLRSEAELRAIRDYIALRLAQHRLRAPRLEPLPPDLLTFADFQELLTALLSIGSQGAVQQFVVAALLKAYHEQQGTGLTVRTKDIFAADKFSKFVGDIEVVDEPAGNRVVDAYEVTLRGWGSRVAEVEQKAVEVGLRRIFIICSPAPKPSELSGLLSKHGAVDIVVLDLASVVAALAGALTPEYRKRALSELEALLGSSDRLWDALAKFRSAVSDFRARRLASTDAGRP